MNSAVFASRSLAMLLIITVSSPASPQTAPADYSRLCAGCHGAEFRIPGDGVPTLRGSEQVADAISNGRPAKGMPAFGGQLSAAAIQDLAQFIEAAGATGASRVGDTVEAESLNLVRSDSVAVMSSPRAPAVKYVGHFTHRGSICYDGVDLTGVRSLEMNYSKGNEDEGRFAILIGDGAQTPRINLAEKRAVPTGSWDEYRTLRVGLDREITGRHLMCIYAVEGGGIFNLDSFKLSATPGEHDGLTLAETPRPERTFTAAGYSFRLEKVAEAPSELWSMAFLPDGTLLAAQKNGQLQLFKNGERLGRVVGLPAVWSAGQGGLMGVQPHPDYSRNGWIYLAFSDPGANPATAMTRVVRGKLQGLRWVEQQDIYRAAPQFYTDHYAHFGSRIAFLDGYLYFSVGERQQPTLAQDLSFPFGKIHRLHDDGRVPRDNPFVARAGALPSIWSYGHRNPQGLTRHPFAPEIWSCEHGPKGGDELNLVKRAANYGWPLVSFGTHYDGTPVNDSPYFEGAEPPVHHWTPSIAVSQVEFYDGKAFPAWRGQALVASLGSEELRLVQLREQQVLNDRLLFKGQGRIRDVSVGPDGYPYLLLNDMKAEIYRLRPVGAAPEMTPASSP
jgi:glucose/arabinose dehydrogenase/cytochrome c553